MDAFYWRLWFDMVVFGFGREFSRDLARIRPRFGASEWGLQPFTPRNLA